MKRLTSILFLLIILSTASTLIAATQKVILMVIPGCVYCAQAKTILDNRGITYSTKISHDGPVPRLYVDDKYQGTGVDAIQTWVNRNAKQ